MRNVVIMIMLISSAFSCKEQEMAAPINETQYTLEQLENDPNWVEITDFEMLEIPCLKNYELEEKYYFKTNDEYQILKNHFYDNSSCSFNALPEVNFDKEEVIGVSYVDSPLYQYDEFQVKLFYNSIEKTIIIYCENEYNLEETGIGRHKIGYIFRKWITKSRDLDINEIKLVYFSNLMD